MTQGDSRLRRWFSVVKRVACLVVKYAGRVGEA